MSTDPRILEENISRLLRLAYVPVPVRPEFRRKLEEEVVALVTDPNFLRWRILRRWSPVIAVAALVMVALGIGWWLGASQQGDAGRSALQHSDFAAAGGGTDATKGLSSPVGVGSREARELEPPRDVVPKTEPERGPAATPGKLALEGTVRFEDGSVPKEFTVWALREDVLPAIPNAKQFADSAGVFRLEGLSGSAYRIFVHAAGAPVVSVRGAAPGSDRSLKITIPKSSGTVRGTVVDAVTGATVAGAVVISETDAPAMMLPARAIDLPADLPARCAVRADGSFELSALSAGVHTIRASAPGYGPTFVDSIDLTAGGVRDAVQIRLARGAAVRGVVRGSAGESLRNVQVIASRTLEPASGRLMLFGRAVTADDGTYRIEDLSEGSYVMLVFEQGSMRPMFDLRYVTVKAGETLEVPLGASAALGTLRGRLRSPRAIPQNAMVTLQIEGSARAEGWRTCPVAPDGTFESSGVPAGTWSVYGTLGFGSSVIAFGKVTIGTSAPTEAVFEAPAESIRGTVVRASNGAPAKGAVAVLYADDGGFIGKTVCGEDGAFELPWIAPGRYSLQILGGELALGHEVVEGLSVSAGVSPAPVQARLEPAGAVEISVVDGDGKPIGGASLELRDGAGRLVRFDDELRSGADGRAPVQALRVGEWTIFAAKDGRRSEPYRLVPTASGVQALRVVLAR